MNISIKNSQIDPLTKITHIDDGKNTLSITETTEGLDTFITLQSNGDSIYPIMDLLKILEGVK